MSWRLILVFFLTIPIDLFSQSYSVKDTSLVLALNQKASAAFNKNVDSISVYAKEALRVAEIINYPKGILYAYASLADYYSMVGEHKQALYYFEESRKTALKINLKKGAASAILGLGMVHFNLGDQAKALEKYLESLSMYEQLDDAGGIGACYNNLGLLYRNEKQYTKAIDAFKAGIASYTRIGKLTSIAGSLANIGSVYQAMKDYKNALLFDRRAYHMFDSLHIVRGQIVSLNNLGEVHTNLDSIELGIEEFSRSLMLSRKHGFERNSVVSLMGLGNANSRKKKYDMAVSYLRDAEIVAHHAKMQRELVLIYDSLGSLFFKLSKFKEAALAYKNSTVMKDSLNIIESTKSINALSIKYEVSKKEDEIKLLQEEKRNSRLSRNIYFAIPVVALFIFFLLYRQQLLKNHRDNQLMRQKEEMLRLNYNSKITEGKLIALRTQLNPHFIFNCLNSINSFILKSDPRTSSEMLLKFAKLVRMILEKSDKKMISFEDELKLMNLYIELEKVKSNGLFDIDLSVDKNINISSVSVPSLIAQPFVENAVIHAFTEKRPENSIRINYYLEGNALFCSVEDNGVGRQQSLSEKENSGIKEKSLGISISEQRLKLLSVNKEEENFVRIDDLFSSENKPIGTRVTVRIPYVRNEE